MRNFEIVGFSANTIRIVVILQVHTHRERENFTTIFDEIDVEIDGIF